VELNLIEDLFGFKNLTRARKLLARAEKGRDPFARKADARKALRQVIKASVTPPAGPKKMKALRAVAKRAERILMESRTPHFKGHDGALAEVTAQTLIEEADWACKFLVLGKQALAQRELSPAFDAFFKASSIAVNVIFTANTHGIEIPDRVVQDMNDIIAQSSEYVRQGMRMIAARKVARHARQMHGKRQVAGTGPGSVRALMEVRN